MRRSALCALMVLAGAANGAWAQSGSMVSVGIAGVLYDPSSGLSHSFQPTPLVRLRLKAGFGPTLGYGAFRAGFADGDARMRMRTLMVGPSYRVERGRIAGSVALLGGYAFARLETAPTGQRLRGTLAWQPSASLWYDASDKFGLHASAGYLFARPSLVVDGPGGAVKRQVRADTLVLRLGVTYAIF